MKTDLPEMPEGWECDREKALRYAVYFWARRRNDCRHTVGTEKVLDTAARFHDWLQGETGP